MAALLEIGVAMIVTILAFSGVLGNFAPSTNLAYITNDQTRMQNDLTAFKQYCQINQNGSPCVNSAGTALPTTGALPNSLTGFWSFSPVEEQSGASFTMNRTAGTACISIDSPAQFTGQYIPAAIPVVDPTSGLQVTKVATTTYYLHADASMGGVYASTAATSTPASC